MKKNDKGVSVSLNISKKKQVIFQISNVSFRIWNQNVRKVAKIKMRYLRKIVKNIKVKRKCPKLPIIKTSKSKVKRKMGTKKIVFKGLKKLIEGNKIKLKDIKNIKMKIKIAYLMCGSQNKRKIANNIKKSSNGNGMKNTNNMKIITWNKGDSNIMEKMCEIKRLIQTQKPKIPFVNELNLNDRQSTAVTNIKNYSFEHDKKIFGKY